MAALLSGESSHHGAPGGNHRVSQENPEEGGGRWYMSRKEIEEDSPSRRDGIDLRKETHLRKSYCTFLQDLGMRLKVPQVTIATAIVFCHRFFLRQSHAKNDKFTIATVCMFLAGKVEETPRPLKDVILVSYEIIHKKDAAKAQKIKQKEVYEQQKELILVGERIVLATLGFDLNVLHPYKPLVEAIKKFKVAQNALAQVAWNFVNDGLRTSLCLQFKPHHIAAGAIFLAGKFLKVKLPQDGWWQEFDVIPRQLEEVSNQMLELYEQNRMPPSQASDAEGTAGGSQRHSSKGPADEEPVSGYSSSHGVNLKAAASLKPPQSRLVPDPPNTENHSEPPRSTQMRNNDYRSSDTSSIPDSRGVNEPNEHELTPNKGNSGEFPNKSRLGIKAHGQDDHEGNSGRVETSDTVEMKDKYHGRNISSKDGIVGQSPQDATKKLDKEKLKAAFERRKARGDITRKIDPEDELERELENVEVPSGSDKSKLERKQNRSKQSNKPDNKNSLHVKHEVGDGHYQAPKGRSSSADDFVKHEVGDGHYQAPKGRSSSVDDFVKHEVGDGHYQAPKGRSSSVDDFDTVEEGELEALDDEDREYQSPKSNPRKRKPDSPLDKSPESGSQKPNNQAYAEDRNGVGRFGYSERDHKRHLQENHV